MYILVSLAFLIIGILTLPFTLRISLKQKNTYYKISLCIIVFGFILYRKIKHDEYLNLTFSKLQKPIRSDISKKKKTRSSKIIFFLLHIGKCKKLIWQSEIGLNDASQTAIATGFIQGIQGIFQQVLLQYTSYTADIYCRPNFKDTVIRNELICIVVFSLGNIIKEIVSGYLKNKWRERV